MPRRGPGADESDCALLRIAKALELGGERDGRGLFEIPTFARRRQPTDWNAWATRI